MEESDSPESLPGMSLKEVADDSRTETPRVGGLEGQHP